MGKVFWRTLYVVVLFSIVGFVYKFKFSKLEPTLYQYSNNGGSTLLRLETPGNYSAIESTLYNTSHNGTSTPLRQEPPVEEGLVVNKSQQHVPTMPYIVEHVDPRALDIKSRFDIIIKTVYAIYLLRGTVPTFVKNMYNRHLEKWNNFHERCVTGQTFSQKWFDGQKPCTKKSSAEDFQRSFSETLNSISHDGFDTNKSLVPVSKSGYPHNGAHRIAAAIALGLPSMPVQRLAGGGGGYSVAFFTRLGVEDKYIDFAMLQWTLHVSNTNTVMFWPEAASDAGQMAQARDVVQQDCGDVLYEKKVNVTQRGVASLARHVYGNQEWLPSMLKQLQTNVSVPDESMRPVYVLFIRPKSTASLNETCKTKLRSRFAPVDPESSVHISDSHDEAVLVAEMVLNPNSVMFLNRHEGGNCQDVAREVATRLQSSPVHPAVFVLPQDIMVDSGAVMSFFGLSNRTDVVDLLFQGKVDEATLGDQRGISVEANSFEHNGTQRACGEGCTVDDFFADPHYYGYCYGVKFACRTRRVASNM